MKVYTYEMLELNGRLGNQLWQIASTIGLASHDSGVVSFKPDWEYRPFFNVPDTIFVPPAEDAELVDRGTEYLQEIQYLRGVEHYIRDWFKPSARSLDVVMSPQYDEFWSIPNRTAVHVRRGDYLKYPNHFSKMTDRYYHTAMEMTGGNFVFFSDDIKWCRKHFGPDHFYVEGVSRPVEVADRKGEPQDQYDLFLMTSCDKHIISNSTFSWWGAWLSDNKHPIYPDKWFESELAYIPAEKMFTEEWIKVEC